VLLNAVLNTNRTTLAAIVRTTASRTAPTEPDGPARLPDGSDAAICSHGARYLQRLIGGVILGYDHTTNPAAELGAAEGGHDFLLVADRYIVDLWGYDFDGRVPDGVLDLHDPADAPLVKQLYGRRECWQVV
jgi:hypothetical protein